MSSSSSERDRVRSEMHSSSESGRAAADFLDLERQLEEEMLADRERTTSVAVRDVSVGYYLGWGVAANCQRLHALFVID